MKWQKVSRNLIRETRALGFYPITYNRLIELFGEPDKGKTPINAEWVIQFERDNGEPDVVIVQYYEDEKKPIEETRRWHVRGYFEDSVLRFDELIKPSTFTPGPWGHSEGEIYRGNNPIAKVIPSFTREDEANARLIAAAPEMYEMLRDLSKVLKDLESIGANLPYYFKDDMSMNDKLREVLAKVDGGEG